MALSQDPTLNTRQIDASISAITARIQKSLGNLEKTLGHFEVSMLDLQNNMKLSQISGKVPGQPGRNELGSFFDKRFEQIANSIKESSIFELKTNKKRLENLEGMAKETLGLSKQGQSVYEQYGLMANKLNEEIKSRSKLGHKIGDFLKRNEIDAISITAALTSRNPIIGLGIKYILEKRKESKEAAKKQEHQPLIDSLAYRDLLNRQKQRNIKPKKFGQKLSTKETKNRKTKETPQTSEEFVNEEVPEILTPEILPPLPRLLKAPYQEEESPIIDAEYMDLGPRQLERGAYQMPPSEPKRLEAPNMQNYRNREGGRFVSGYGITPSVKDLQGQPMILDKIEKPLEDIKVSAIGISKEIALYHRENKEQTDEQLDAEEKKKEDEENRQKELIDSIESLKGKKSDKTQAAGGHGIFGGLLGGLFGGLLSKFGGIGSLLSSAGPIAMVGGSILLLAVDSILGYFKSSEWGVSKVAGTLGGMLGGSIKNKMLNTFTQMGKWALIGATIGSFVPVIGTLAGGLLGAAIGGILGWIGGENIAKFFQSSGEKIGKLFKSITASLEIAFYNFAASLLDWVPGAWASHKASEFRKKAREKEKESEIPAEPLPPAGGKLPPGKIETGIDTGNIHIAVPGENTNLGENAGTETNKKELLQKYYLSKQPLELQQSPINQQLVPSEGIPTMISLGIPGVNENVVDIQDMHLDDNGYKKIKGSEASNKFHPTPYWDVDGYSIGFGHKILPNEHFTKITKSDAENLLVHDAQKAENLVKKYVHTPVTQKMFDSLVDFAYNVPSGIPNIAENMNVGDFRGAAKRMKLYTKVKDPKGKFVNKKTGERYSELPGLVARRKEDADLLTSDLIPDSNNIRQLTPPPPQSGVAIMAMTKQNEDLKATQSTSGTNSTVIIPSNTNLNTTAVLSQQQDPNNLDNTYRDTRRLNAFGGG
jgi:GH24 family phage-related lysozyme (muramidase)